MKLTMVGAHYVGLVSGACLADFGHQVTCVDIDAAKIDALRTGDLPVYEPGLEALVQRNVRSGRLRFTTELAGCADHSDAVFIAVGTPGRRGTGQADLTDVYAVARQLAPLLRGFTVVILKSTVPVGTGDEVERILREGNPDARISVASNPEFLREGAAIRDFKHPDRIVCGVEDTRAREVLTRIYRPLRLEPTPMLFTTRRAAELIKYASNAFLATRITFVNEMADLCERVGVDVLEVTRGMGLDRRIGPEFLHPGPGYGGSCFPKDTRALADAARDAGAPTRIVEAVIAANDARKRGLARRVESACGGLDGRTVAILGVTFKPNTDDVREAPSLVLIPALQEAGARVRAHDPQARRTAPALLPGVDFVDDPYAAVEGADALVILTEWEAFRALDLDRVHALMKAPTIVDLRNVYRPEEMRERGFDYTSIGRP